MKVNFCSLSSGSSGNCYYLGNEFHGILIDAGISAGAIRKFLKELGISMNSLMGILITHDHTDHMRGLEVLSRKVNIPIFTTHKIWKGLLSSSRKISPDCIRYIQPNQKFHLAGFDIEAFPVFHDAEETVGYHLCSGENNITIVTDLGHICETAARYINAANFLVIESNYDEYMLQNGSYPAFLKARIQSDNGHLGNQQTAAFLAETFHDKLSHICLAHLSKNNNTPEKALQSLCNRLTEKGILPGVYPKITVLNRSIPSEMIRIGQE